MCPASLYDHLSPSTTDIKSSTPEQRKKKASWSVNRCVDTHVSRRQPRRRPAPPGQVKWWCGGVVRWSRKLGIAVDLDARKSGQLRVGQIAHQRGDADVRWVGRRTA